MCHYFVSKIALGFVACVTSLWHLISHRVAACLQSIFCTLLHDRLQKSYFFSTAGLWHSHCNLDDIACDRLYLGKARVGHQYVSEIFYYACSWLHIDFASICDGQGKRNRLLQKWTINYVWHIQLIWERAWYLVKNIKVVWLVLFCCKIQCGIFRAAVDAVKFLLSLLYAYHFFQFPAMHLCGNMPLPSFECVS